MDAPKGRRKSYWSIQVVLVLFIGFISCAIGYMDNTLSASALQKRTFSTIDVWSSRLNAELLQINQFTAFYAWELSTHPTEQMSQQSISFNAFKSQWIDVRCAEVDDMPNAERMNGTVDRMVQLLCRGPRFDAEQTKQLSQQLFAMQTTFTETRVCIPLHFDVCQNLDLIWEWTFVQRPDGSLMRLNMNAVRMDLGAHRTKLVWYTGNITNDDYFVFGPENDEAINQLDVNANLLKGPFLCLDGESDMENMMGGHFESFRRNDCALRVYEVTRWAWEAWRLAVGVPIGKIFPVASALMNGGAQVNGYQDIGQVWREELELPDLRSTVDQLMSDIRPFYETLHAVLRNVLWHKVQSYEAFDPLGPIPAHLLGSMWSQSWQVYHKLLMPGMPIEGDLDLNVQRTQWTSRDMVNRADDFYSSMGLPPMTATFWKKSLFERSNKETHEKCHGTAANMFEPDDYRIIVCAAQRTIDDLYVIVHELGHLQYYMAFDSNQPPIFQDANSALQESIGDSIFLAFMTPQHLHRLRLIPDTMLIEQNPTTRFHPADLISVPGHSSKSVSASNVITDGLNHLLTDPRIAVDLLHLLANDVPSNDATSTSLKSQLLSVLTNIYPNVTDASEQTPYHQRPKTTAETAKPSVNEFDLSLLLRMALAKIPQIPFEYIIDVYRWDLFSNKVPMEKANGYFWYLLNKHQGIGAPGGEQLRGNGQFFDAGAKFHVADNTPFVRYFLASFIHAQIFRGLCEATVFGKVNSGQELPMPLHRCDIYGSKRAGKLIKKALKIGASQPWQEVLFILTGSLEIRADALLQYYRPLIAWLQEMVNEYNIPMGW